MIGLRVFRNFKKAMPRPANPIHKYQSQAIGLDGQFIGFYFNIICRFWQWR
jgi:hypothetical protein